MIMFFIASLIAAGIGFCFILAKRSRRENAEVYSAVLIGVRESYRMRGGVMYKIVKPVVRYNNGRKDITAEYHDWITKSEFRRSDGEEVEIRAYPQLPKIFYFAEDDDHVSYEAIAFFVAAGFLFAIGILCEICFG